MIDSQYSTEISRYGICYGAQQGFFDAAVGICSTFSEQSKQLTISCKCLSLTLGMPEYLVRKRLKWCRM